MECKNIMERDVRWVLPDIPVAQAARTMATHRLGMLPVCGPDAKPIGVLTDRDIAIRLVGKNRSPVGTKVEEIMSVPIQYVSPWDSVDVACERMTQSGVSRLLVLDAAGRLDGVVSLADVLAHASDQRALDTARGIAERDRTFRDSVPREGSASGPFAFGETTDAESTDVPIPDTPSENEARLEADHVISGGASRAYKEFPG